MKAHLIIRCEGPTVWIKDPETGKERKYSFDFTYWSHDGFIDAPNGGYLHPKPGSAYADQDLVMK
jgi:kinesin family member 1